MITFNSYDLGNKNYKNSSAKNVAFGTHLDQSAKNLISTLHKNADSTPSKELISVLNALGKDGLDNLYVKGISREGGPGWSDNYFQAYEASDPKTTISLWPCFQSGDFRGPLPEMLKTIKSDIFEELAKKRANNAANASRERSQEKNKQEMQQQLQNTLSALS